MRETRHSIREFEALRALVTAGTTVGAARRLGVSQSAVSRALSQLESRLGRILFTRSAGRIEPTAEALSLNATLDPLFEALGRIEGADWAEAESRPLRLATPPTLAHNFVLARVAGFLARDARRRVQVEILPTDQIVTGIADQRYDLGLTSAMIQSAGVRLEPWRRSRAVCVMPPGHPLAARDEVTAEDLDGAPFVHFVRRLGTRTLLDQLLARAGVEVRAVAETATNMACVELVRLGAGVSVVNPFPVLSAGMEGVLARPFRSAIVYRTSFVLATDRPPAAQARAFMRHMRLATPADPYSEPM